MKKISIKESYKYCHKLTFHAAKNFYFAFITLPKNLKNDIYSVYAFCRIADDIADDENLTVSEKEQLFKLFKNNFNKCFNKNQNINHPLFTGLKETITTHNLSYNHLWNIAEGVKMDLYKMNYDTFEELYNYCYKVASEVAFVCVELFVPQKLRNENTNIYAENLGLGLQITNILRDIKEDFSYKRRYIPIEWLNKFNLTEDQYHNAIKNKDYNKIKDLINFIISIAEKHYQIAINNLDNNTKPYLKTLEIIRKIYSELLNKIKKNPKLILQERVSVSFIKKLSFIVK